jgi:hypothetical protein
VAGYALRESLSRYLDHFNRNIQIKKGIGKYNPIPFIPLKVQKNDAKIFKQLVFTSKMSG